MERVIQDSDDDSDEELLEQQLEREVASGTGSHNALMHEVAPSPASGEHGSGSTESLKRNIEAAHRAHFQSPPDASDSKHDGILAPDLIDGSASKRRRVLASASTGAPSGNQAALGQLPEKTLQPECSQSNSLMGFNPATISLGDGALEDHVWQLEGTMRDEYARHEPMALFPEPSSTIPNATLTQQRLLEEVMDPAFLGIGPTTEVETARYEPHKSSIPWSEYLKTPSDHTDVRSNPSNTQDGLVPTPQQLAQSQLATKDVPLSPVEVPRERAASQCSALGTTAPLHEEASSTLNIVCSKAVKQSMPKTPAQSSPIGMKSQELHSGNTAVFEQSSQFGSSSKNRNYSQARRVSSSPEVIGLPEEQYKPRPSRSRAMKIDLEEPIDYSKRPEQAAKRTTRRSKTLDNTENVATMATPRRTRQIVDMGFTPSTTQRALVRNNGNVSQTVDWLVTNVPTDVDELAAPMPRPKVKSRVRKPRTQEVLSESPSIISEHPHLHEEVIVQPEPPNQSKSSDTVRNSELSVGADPRSPGSKSSKVQVVISSSHMAMAHQAQEEVYGLDQVEDHTTVSKLEVATGKKKGRGRPRKVVVADIATEVPIIETDENKATAGRETDLMDDASGRTKASLKDGITDEVSTKIDKDSFSITVSPVLQPSAPATGTSNAARTDTSSEKQSKAVKKELISPHGTGKASYRVGLSKRARIAPLLKIMKK